MLLEDLALNSSDYLGRVKKCAWDSQGERYAARPVIAGYFGFHFTYMSRNLNER